MTFHGLTLVVSLLVLLLGPLRVRAQATPAYPLIVTTLREPALVDRERALDGELARIQRNTRLYLLSWTVANTALAAAQLAIALSSDSAAVRSNYIVGAGLSAAGLGVLYGLYSWPGFHAHRRYRARVVTDLATRAEKVAFGEGLAARQREEDASAGAPLKHIVSAAVAAASGVRAGMSFESVGQGVGRALFVLSVLELQILTRPGHWLTRHQDRRRGRPLTVAVTPWWKERGSGVSLQGVF